ncbi:putative Ig domain-containing protein [Lentisphaerota bacterium WC36G]|nr:putative Ig domain-containing protein [Lentisphaerae bacterium WC36]
MKKNIKQLVTSCALIAMTSSLTSCNTTYKTKSVTLADLNLKKASGVVTKNSITENSMVVIYLEGHGKLLTINCAKNLVVKLDRQQVKCSSLTPIDISGVQRLEISLPDDGDKKLESCPLQVNIEYHAKGTKPQTVNVAERFILTPKAPKFPLINSARIFGIRPNNPFLYTVAASGVKPMRFKAKNLPAGLKINSRTGVITGKIADTSEATYKVTLMAENRFGSTQQELTIKVGETICLTPPMGWNSWYCWSESVSQDKVIDTARSFVKTGIKDYGWTYVNIDDCWQGVRGGKYNAIQGNERFPNMKFMADAVHNMGLKVGIYSSPWQGTYAGFIGGSAPSADGRYDSLNLLPENKRKQKHQFFGSYPGSIKRGAAKVGPHWFFAQDAKQFADWGIDYIKVDWNPNDVPTTKRMAENLRASGRDIVYSLSNKAPFKNAAGLAKYANLWRTTGDIHDTWGSIAPKGFGANKWRKFQSQGHWNDPDMLQIGNLGKPNQYVKSFKKNRLTPDEQYTQITLWSFLSAPLLLSCDIESLDKFTLNLLKNREILAINQDPKGIQAYPVMKKDGMEIWVKPLAEENNYAVAIFNNGNNVNKMISFNWSDVDFTEDGKKYQVEMIRDLWRQRDVTNKSNITTFRTNVHRHGVEAYRVKLK